MYRRATYSTAHASPALPPCCRDAQAPPRSSWAFGCLTAVSAASAASTMKGENARECCYASFCVMSAAGDQSWVFFGRNDAKAETPILWPPYVKSWLIGKDWYWEGLRAGGEGDDRGWDGWMASPTPWTWVWVNSGSWWGTGRPAVLQFMGSQRVGHDWVTELIWTGAMPARRE